MTAGSVEEDQAPASGRRGSLSLARRRSNVGSSESLLSRYGGGLLILVLGAVWTFTLPERFLTSGNLVGILNDQALTALLALGVIFPLAAGVFDISIAGTMSLGVIVSTALFQKTSGNMPVIAAILVPVAIGVAAGCVNAYLVVKIGVDPFISTIGLGTVLDGLSEMISNGQTFYLHIPNSFLGIGRGQVGRLELPVLYTVGVAIVALYVLEYTPLGRYLYASGANREAARLSGVRTGRVITIAYMLSGACAAFVGVVYAARLGDGPPEIGDGFLLPAYSAAFLGSTMIKPGRFNVAGVLVAVLLLAVGINGIQLAGGPFWVQPIFQGGALVLAVVFAKLRRRGPLGPQMRRKDEAVTSSAGAGND